VKISVRNDLEKHNFLIKVLRIFTVPVMNHIPKSLLQNMMTKTSHDAGTVVKTGGSTMALEVMYTRYHRGLFSRGILQGLADLFWHHFISQPKALRNRLKIVEEAIESRMVSLIKGGQEDLNILNIGGGSSRALIHAIDRLREEKYDFKPKVFNVDKDQRAIDAGKEISKKFNMSDVFVWINDDARNLESLIESGSVDMAEMVGLMDYFDEERAIKVLHIVHESLKDGGLFIVANVGFNNEMKFVEKTGWPFMYYRRVEDLERIIKKAGFDKEPNFILEPTGVHIVAIVEK